MISVKPLTTSLHESGVPENVVRGRFKKGYKKLEKLCRLDYEVSALFKVAEKPQCIEKAKEILTDIKVWGMHFLVRDAKIPVFNQTGALFLPFHEYLLRNEDSYFRGDGGSILSIYKNHLKGRFPALSPHKLDLINPEKYAALIQRCCSSSEMKFYGGPFAYKKVGSCDEICQSASRTYVDVTQLLQESLKESPQKFEEMLGKINTLACQLPDDTVIGGMVALDNGVGVCIRFEPQGGRSDSASEAIKFGLFGQFKNYRGLMGACPEMLLIKRSLINLGFDFKTLLTQSALDFPVKHHAASPSAVTEYEAQSKLKDLSVRLHEISTQESVRKNALSFHYLSFLSALIDSLGQGQIRKVGDAQIDQVFTTQIMGAIQNIHKRMNAIEKLLSHPSGPKEEARFAEVLQELYLAFEEAVFLMIFFPPTEGPSPKLETVLDSVFPLDKGMSSLGIERSFFPFNSGMSCHEHILSAHIAANGSGETKKKAVFVEGSYKELTDDPGLKDYLDDACESCVLSPKQILSTPAFDCDLLLLDLYPNCVTLKEVKTNPVVDLVRHALANRSMGGPPLTVVLDTTAGLISDPQVDQTIDQLKQEIAAGRIIFVISTSLAKFYNLGLDKYSGGLLSVYRSSKNPFSRDVVQQLEVRRKSNTVSAESQRFFSLLFSTSLPVIEHYYRDVKENTQYLYAALREELQRQDSCIRLGVKDPEILMLGLQFDEYVEKVIGGQDLDSIKSEAVKANFARFFKLFLYKRFIHRELPIYLRRSFSFPNASLTEFGTALRMVVGLEDRSIIDQYAHEIKVANGELKNFLSSSGVERLVKLLLKNEGEFAESTAVLLPLINDNRDVSFEEFVNELCESNL